MKKLKKKKNKKKKKNTHTHKNHQGSVPFQYFGNGGEAFLIGKIGNKNKELEKLKACLTSYDVLVT